MKKGALAAALSLLSFCILVDAQIPRPQGKACTTLGRPDIIVQPHEVLSGRYPSPEILNVSDSCKAAAKKQVDEWHAEDIANWEQLSNQACSAELGWVEKVPGTCTAGGPPPVCPVDHWVQRPAEAKQAFKERNRQKQAERVAKLMEQACRCTKSELAGVREKAKISSTSPYQNPYINPYLVSCTGAGSNCPPGYECVNGVCSLPSQLQRQAEQVGESAMEIGKRADDVFKVSETVLSKMSTHLGALLRSTTWKVVSSPYMEFLDAKPMSMWLDGYNKNAQEVGWKIQRLQGLYKEYDAFRQGRPARAPQMIGQEIQSIKNQLNNDVQKMNEFYRGVVVERELGRYSCYEVFEFQHQQVMQSFANLMSLPVPNAPQ
jgi:hypothetical protein